MRVIHYTNDVAEASGVGTFVRRLNAELVRQGVDSSVVTDPAALPSASENAILHIHGLWLKVHHRAAAWARTNGVPVVWSPHGMLSPWALRHKRWKKLPAWFLYQGRDLASAAAIHVTSEQEAAWVRARGLVQRQIFAPLGSDVPSEESLAPESERTLLFVGRLHPVKAVDRLIEAFARCGRTDWRLRLVGPDEGGHRAALEALVGRLGCASRVEFVGPRYGEDLAREYNSCAALALVSETENFGATVVDAMAHAKPVVTGDRTPWKIVAERGAGWWTPNTPEKLAETLGELMALDPSARHEMGLRGRRLVLENYTWPSVARQMTDGYLSLLEEKG